MGHYKWNLCPAAAFEVWDTKSGEVSITYREHSVVIVGYDENHIVTIRSEKSRVRQLIEKNSKRRGCKWAVKLLAM